MIGQLRQVRQNMMIRASNDNDDYDDECELEDEVPTEPTPSANQNEDGIPEDLTADEIYKYTQRMRKTYIEKVSKEMGRNTRQDELLLRSLADMDATSNARRKAGNDDKQANTAERIQQLAEELFKLNPNGLKRAEPTEKDVTPRRPEVELDDSDVPAEFLEESDPTMDVERFAKEQNMRFGENG